MIQARRRFLSADYYSELLQTLITLVKSEAPSSSASTEATPNAMPMTWLDVGCGEGYYTGHLQQAMPLTQWQGIDIAKEAIKLAASSYTCTSTYTNTHANSATYVSSDATTAQFAVASSRRIPKAENSCDGILQIFTPSFPAEISRVLKPEGQWIRVTPGPAHLTELRQAIYPSARPHSAPEIPAGFKSLPVIQHGSSCDTHTSEHASEHKVMKTITLDSAAAIQDLLAMTPYQWHGDPAAKAALSALSELTITLDFRIERLQLN